MFHDLLWYVNFKADFKKRDRRVNPYVVTAASKIVLYGANIGVCAALRLENYGVQIFAPSSNESLLCRQRCTAKGALPKPGEGTIRVSVNET